MTLYAVIPLQSAVTVTNCDVIVEQEDRTSNAMPIEKLSYRTLIDQNPFWKHYGHRTRAGMTRFVSKHMDKLH